DYSSRNYLGEYFVRGFPSFAVSRTSGTCLRWRSSCEKYCKCDYSHYSDLYLDRIWRVISKTYCDEQDRRSCKEFFRCCTNNRQGHKAFCMAAISFNETTRQNSSDGI